MIHSIRRLSEASGVLVAALFLASCSKQETEYARAASLEAVPILAAEAVQQNVPVQLKAIGTVEPYLIVTVRPQVSGQVSKVHFIEGQDVKAGDLLFEIDSRPFEAALRQAQANLDHDRAMAKDAKDEAKRQEELRAKHVAAEREYEQAMARADAAEATVRADEALVETARLKLSYCQIRSPIHGRTGTRMVDAGNIVKENDTAMVVINQISPIYVTFSLPEQYLPQVKSRMAGGSKLAVYARIAGQEQPEEGLLTFLDNRVHTETGTIQLKGTFQNPQRQLWPGQFVEVALTLYEISDAVVVPSAAVQAGQAGEFVFVVTDKMTAEPRPVTVSNKLDGHSVIEQGVRAGETVVTDGQLRLVPGSRVSIKTGLLPTTATAPAGGQVQ